ncbi:MAG TPA: hypothetical protein VFP72_18330 [Kineosporiaceae bacterium]|nr:hypothetical protein [Kineosporiaceae bacterium]
MSTTDRLLSEIARIRVTIDDATHATSGDTSTSAQSFRDLAGAVDDLAEVMDVIVRRLHD